MEQTRILLVGALGRMGQEVLRAAAAANNTDVVGGIVAPGELEQAQRELDIPVDINWCAEFAEANVIVEFSSPAGSVTALEIACEQNLPVLLCSTGHQQSEFTAKIASLEEEAAKRVPIIRASNTSIAVNVLINLAEQAGRLLDERYDVEVTELHHNKKVDAPSGTALSLLEAVGRGRGVNVSEITHLGRQNEPRKQGEYGVHSLRGGDAAGEHTVYFIGDGERIELTQRATRREVYATGAVDAARWLAVQGRAAGWYAMRDVIGGGPSINSR